LVPGHMSVLPSKQADSGWHLWLAWFTTSVPDDLFARLAVLTDAPVPAAPWAE
jgi:hypothetical protein